MVSGRSPKSNCGKEIERITRIYSSMRKIVKPTDKRQEKDSYKQIQKHNRHNGRGGWRNIDVAEGHFQSIFSHQRHTDEGLKMNMDE